MSSHNTPLRSVDYEEPKKLWCKTHPLSPWGKDQFGDQYAQCYTGKMRKERGVFEECVEGGEK